MTPNDTKPVLEVSNLRVSFSTRVRGGGVRRVVAVDDVGLAVFPRQTLAVVGESGCGKSVTALSIMGLVRCPPGHIESGSIELSRDDGADVDLRELAPRELRKVRGREIGMIFQEPMTSLNPVMSVGDQICEAVMAHRKISKHDAVDVAVAAMKEVGILDARERIRAYPHQFSGGMRQRVMIAMALACRPRVLIADEPTTALDVTVQAQILKLISNFKETRDLGVLLITHDMGVVAEASEVVCVMYAGRVVEYGRVSALYERPLHPYTRGLLASVPVLGHRRDRLAVVGDAIRESLGREGGDSPLADGVAAWWPDLPPPPDVLEGEGDASALVEVEPERWVRVWQTPATAALPLTPPRLPPEVDTAGDAR